MFEAVVLGFFLSGYALIVLEHRWYLPKAVTAASLGVALWLVIALWQGDTLKEETQALGGEIFGFVFFLFAAMMLVGILAHYRLFDFIRAHLLKLGLTDLQQFWALGVLTFGLSAVIDNLTATIVMVQIALRFFRGKNLLIAVTGIVIAANAGGAFSPIGDVTTIMLWLAGKFSAQQVITEGFFPSLSMLLVRTWLLARGMKHSTRDLSAEEVSLSWSERCIIGVALGSFSLPVMFSEMGLEPYFGLFAGIGLTYAFILLFRNFGPRETHLTITMKKIFQEVNSESLLFFAGILLAVGALGHVGLLEDASQMLFGESPSFIRLVAGSTALGVFSAVVDNIPLTAAAIEIIKTSDPSIWVLLALTAGIGGSILVIGSAAGVIAMGMVKDLTFGAYLRIATLPAIAGYIVAIAVWFVQRQLVFS